MTWNFTDVEIVSLFNVFVLGVLGMKLIYLEKWVKNIHEKCHANSHQESKDKTT